MNAQLILADPVLHSGTTVFTGTRVPIQILFDQLKAGDSLEVFLQDFPSVSQELAIAVLEDAKASEPSVLITPKARDVVISHADYSAVSVSCALDGASPEFSEVTAE